MLLITIKNTVSHAGDVLGIFDAVTLNLSYNRTQLEIIVQVGIK